MTQPFHLPDDATRSYWQGQGIQRGMQWLSWLVEANFKWWCGVIASGVVRQRKEIWPRTWWRESLPFCDTCHAWWHPKEIIGWFGSRLLSINLAKTEILRGQHERGIAERFIRKDSHSRKSVRKGTFVALICARSLKDRSQRGHSHRNQAASLDVHFSLWRRRRWSGTMYCIIQMTLWSLGSSPLLRYNDHQSHCSYSYTRILWVGRTARYCEYSP